MFKGHRVKFLFIRTLLFALSPESLRILTGTSSSKQPRGHSGHNFTFDLSLLVEKHHCSPSPPFIYFSFQHSFLVLLLRPACAVAFKAKSRGDKGLKAINNQMLSEPHWRKRMQLYEQDPGLRQTTVCSRSLWGPAWKWESGGVAWQTLSSVYFSLLFYPWSNKQEPHKPISLLRDPPTHPTYILMHSCFHLQLSGCLDTINLILLKLALLLPAIAQPRYFFVKSK